MKYYDSEFRSQLTEMLNNYRKLLVQMESNCDKTQIIFVSESIKKVDLALKIIKPSIFDFIDEKKIQKLQESRYCKKLVEETKQSVRAECDKEAEKSLREKIEAELRAELTPKIKEELQAEKAKRKAAKKARKQAENMDDILEKIKVALSVETPTNQSTATPAPPTTAVQPEIKETEENEDDWGNNMPEPHDSI